MTDDEKKERRKQFVRSVDALCVRHARGKVWRDMIAMWALSISNAVDVGQRCARTAEYERIAGGYTAEEITRFAELLGMLTLIYEADGFGDVLGSLYMEMDMGNDAGGQFFTPYNVTRMMASFGLDSVEAEIRAGRYATINDPACGGGATLIAAAEQLLRDGVNYQTSVIFVGQDVDYETALMCYVQMSLLGMPGVVKIGDTLRAPEDTPSLLMSGTDVWRTPMLYMPVWIARRIAETDRQMREAGRRE